MASPKGKPGKTPPQSAAKVAPVTDNQPPGWCDIKHFIPREFSCKCEGLCDHPVAISLDLVTKLDAIRDLIGRPLSILSGTRCERHNRRVGGNPSSSHLPRDGVSHAADIHCPDAGFRFAFLAVALPIFNRMGIGKDFIHVDLDPSLPPHRIWLYGP